MCRNPHFTLLLEVRLSVYDPNLDRPFWTSFDRTVFQPHHFYFFSYYPIWAPSSLSMIGRLQLPEIICVISITTTSYASGFGRVYFGLSHIFHGRSSFVSTITDCHSVCFRSGVTRILVIPFWAA